jgi:hypothetical protein
MKPIKYNLKEGYDILKIRTGQIFQLESTDYGCFKGPAYVDEFGTVFFLKPDGLFVHNFYVDTCYYLDPIAVRK